MQIIKRVGVSSIWFAGLLFAFAAANKNDPYLIALRGPGNIVLFLASIVAFIILIRCGYWRRRTIAGRMLVLLWSLPSLSMMFAQGSFELRKQDVLQTEPIQARGLGQHFIVGYSSFPEVAVLAEKGLIGGIYITKHNVGRSVDTLKAEIAALQDKRRTAGLPPLIVAADQEGGIVSHLAPPLTRMPALSTLASLSEDVRAEQAETFGRIHGQELAALGVNLNLAPVLDLRPEARSNRFDFNTLIGHRAISNDPAVVAAIAGAYVHGLEASGVDAAVKHFPGLGRVRADTHHFSADLDTPVAELEESDWRPFREVLENSRAHLMIGHVTLTAVDPGRAASHSRLVVDGIIRKKWNYQGVIMTDDLVMGAIYQHNVCTAVVEALNAGVDLLLVAFDGAQFYRIFGCAKEASSRGQLDSGVLRESEARLKRASAAD